ncbi:hypothetical protein [Clavibacter sp. VKM Ac-2872]|uniref:hypothetical protein n=1 Tax=Clavibacter sp. VKM Ac-2872 TaxID=2783812 RepID=UPI00188A5BC4|nr:hypothetical protein [Clavibacter sp. VKM Ac-2872]MBF4623166.1 hypothetical protein [Clavibacter sp. VKM Ac-2872]
MSFVLGAWLNRRYTRLPSSMVLGGIPGVAIIVMEASSSTTKAPSHFVLLSMVMLVQTITYPLAREAWFRLTQPMREGLGSWTIPLLLVPVVFALRFYVYVVIWAFAVPLGVAGFVYLAVGERAGRGWRLS